MKIMGVDLKELAQPASLEISENELGTVFKMGYCGLYYRYVLSHFELLNLNSNDLIIEHITNIINEGKYRLGIKVDENIRNEST